MKKLLLTLTAIAGLALLGLTGCSKSDSGGATLDTSKLQSAFASATAVDKPEVEKAISALKAGDYTTAIASLKQAAANVKITPEQQQAIKDLLAQAQAKLGAAASDTVDKAKAAASDASKAADDLKKAVTK